MCVELKTRIFDTKRVIENNTVPRDANSRSHKVLRESSKTQ